MSLNSRYSLTLNWQVNFLSKLVALKPGKALERMIKDVMNGRGEGADNIEPSAASHSEQESLTGVLGRVSFEFKLVH